MSGNDADRELGARLELLTGTPSWGPFTWLGLPQSMDLGPSRTSDMVVQSSKSECTSRYSGSCIVFYDPTL